MVSPKAPTYINVTKFWKRVRVRVRVNPMYALAWILRNTDLKYSKYYSLLMLGSSHIRFAPEIE